MPRVSEAYLTARRQQILEAAWRCFARDGFHATSMQDIFAESGLSAGAVYRYFPSKLDLIKATAETVTGGIEEAFEVIVSAEPVPPPDETFRIVADTVLGVVESGGAEVSRVAVHVWSEALREPDVGDLVKEVGFSVRRRWVDIAARWQAAGHISATADLDDVGRLFYGLMVGFVLERNLLGDVTPEQYVAGITALLK